MAKNDGGPAFPRTGYYPETDPEYGMSLRDYFAGQALVALSGITLPEEMRKKLDASPGGAPRAVAKTCYQIADEMLAARSK
jgi:hypothetical protein